MMCMNFFHRRKARSRKPQASLSSKSHDISSDTSSAVKDVKMGSCYFGIQMFSCDELLKATDNFDSAKRLGDEVSGTVYFGKLYDGRAAAVKHMKDNTYKGVEQFMNEVQVLSRLRHQNLVSLYGCTSRRSRELLLVYEYIPNGSVADHLHGERAKLQGMPWSTRMNIAIETASALAYLHASDIIHRDIKTSSILLDNNFHVKLVGFGLCLHFPFDVAYVSSDPQGTPGYIDPEYQQTKQLTCKSDVFSFGVVLMELISSKPAVDISRPRHQINLSTMSMNMIQNHALNQLVDPCLGFESDLKVRRMISAVAELAFQCLQCEKEMRPSVLYVLEELKSIHRRDFEADGNS